ncbi:MAG: hypothetical protein HY663_06030 [Chloroflexi bacterium]|nr:hypothetical protein [Chloroflexota bacterium]
MKALRLVGTVIMVVAFLGVSCAPGPVVTIPPASTGAPTPTSAPASTSMPAATPVPTIAEKPKYGGIINVMRPDDPDVWDAALLPRFETLGTRYLFDPLSYQDWAKGLAGTGEVDWGSGIASFDAFGPMVAESWEIPELGTWNFKMRKGIHWALNPASEASRLVNGRELTVDDILWNFNRHLKTSSNANIRLAQPLMSAAASWEKTGPWEFTLKIPTDPVGGWSWTIVSVLSYHPPEVVQKYGDASDWRNRVGFGPFMVTDYVSGSAATLIRNPNYWMKDPVGPGKGNQLPYVDTLKVLVVPDISTRMAAMRTGRADWVDAVEAEDSWSLIKTSPQLKYYKYLPTSQTVIAGRLNKVESPFRNRLVRQALMLATDFQTLKNDLYRGEAEILHWPIGPYQPNLYMPMDKLPESVQALYKYNPERANHLLAEAGYPNGFKAKMIVQNTSTMMDLAAAFKAMWAKVGVDLEIQPKEGSVFTAISRSRAHDEFILRGSGIAGFPWAYPALTNIRGSGPANASYINDPPGTDPYMEGLAQEIYKNVIINFPKADQLYREKLIPYLLEQAFVIPSPTPYSYRFWSPWIKNYHGEPIDMAISFIWIDQDLKEQMTGRK